MSKKGNPEIDREELLFGIIAKAIVFNVPSSSTNVENDKVVPKDAIHNLKIRILRSLTTLSRSGARNAPSLVVSTTKRSSSKRPFLTARKVSLILLYAAPRLSPTDRRKSINCEPTWLDRKPAALGSTIVKFTFLRTTCRSRANAGATVDPDVVGIVPLSNSNLTISVTKFLVNISTISVDDVHSRDQAGR